MCGDETKYTCQIEGEESRKAGMEWRNSIESRDLRIQAGKAGNDIQVPDWQFHYFGWPECISKCVPEIYIFNSIIMTIVHIYTKIESSVT
jgi:hypothetical protein